MNYTQLDDKKKAQIDVLLENGYSMRESARMLGISHSTISRYKAGIYQKRKIDIRKKYSVFIDYFYNHYDRRYCSVDIVIHKFKYEHKIEKCPSVQQVYNWIKNDKLEIKRSSLCYKRKRANNRKSGMMQHFEWNLNNRTVLPISLRPKYVEKRNELGHLEIDSIVGKKNEQASIISIVDRCSRMLWLIKSEYKNEYYTDKLIYEYILENRITVKSITVDNGLEFKALGLCAKRLGVKLYKCDPYCSFQRGTNERTNALVRRWIPKGTSMRNVPQIWLDDICFQINTMPRKIFDYHTPIGIDLNYQ